uniref:YqaJ viral recombinase domain-containing protein n=1 Tax=Amphimedon queenslandica TaxID=400682 RepID=A0A1X7SGF2_AMPQE
MVYDPRPTHFRESNTAEAIENLRCSLLRIGKPCAFLNVFIPSKAKIALDHNYSQSKVLHDHDYCHSNQTSWQQYSPQEDTNDEISSLLGEDDQLTAEDVLEALSVNKEQQEELESKTRSQSNSSVWFTERRRRITGSKCGRIIAQKEHTVSLLRSVIYQKPIIQLPNSLKWGKENEDNACAEYVRYMNGHGHCGLHTQKAGFVVDTEKCWLGASPDAWVVDPSSENSNGIAEFKCPYVMANKTPEEMCQNKSFFCEIVNGKIHLKNNHSYYHQVQLQLYVTRSKAKWCDFCIYSTKGISVQRIFPDNDWQETSCLKLDDYFLNHILPELVYPQFKPSYFL